MPSLGNGLVRLATGSGQVISAVKSEVELGGIAAMPEEGLAAFREARTKSGSQLL